MKTPWLAEKELGNVENDLRGRCSILESEVFDPLHLRHSLCLRHIHRFSLR